MNTAVAFYRNSIQTPAFSGVARPPHKRLKAYLCWGKRLKRLCPVWKQESLLEWTTFPLSCLRMEVRQEQVLTAICQKILETKEQPKEWTQSLIVPLPKEAASSNVRAVVPSAWSAVPARSCWVILNPGASHPAFRQMGICPTKNLQQQKKRKKRTKSDTCSVQ